MISTNGKCPRVVVLYVRFPSVTDSVAAADVAGQPSGYLELNTYGSASCFVEEESTTLALSNPEKKSVSDRPPEVLGVHK